ncbi:MAG: HAMP domain-containing histidine kinase [Verrucomicrobiaceae bacterium]|nr:MAG: HAMP domain-containing histidine kinase [Verrucomicrobiaceae bacterium]
MKHSRSLLVWATLALCGVMVLGAMTWLTRGVLATERQRAEAEARADLEECTRLALWRMDAAGTAIVAAENRRLLSDYQPGSTAFTSPPDPMVKLHFELRENGRLISPATDGTPEKLKSLRSLLGDNPLPGDEWSMLCRAAAAGETAWNQIPKEAPVPQAVNKDQREVTDRSQIRKGSSYQWSLNTVDKAQRARSVESSLQNSQNGGFSPPSEQLSKATKPSMPSSPKDAAAAIADAEAAGPPVLAERPADFLPADLVPALGRTPENVDGPEDRSASNSIGAMRAIWIGNELFLLRQFSDGGEKGVQGVWLDQELLQRKLLDGVIDLLPHAALSRVAGVVQDPLALASLPLLLVRNEAAIAPGATISGPLLIGWIAVLLALLTASLLVHGVMRLSERRASFVSAVTHELRTPLTTFRLYSDMLESGAVREEKRGDYLRVLSREADRLSHLVENVLSFSKIERGSARSAVRECSVRELLGPMRERLEARLATAGLTLQMSADIDARVRVDAAAVEHILFNLIDNAAKYAATSEPPVVELVATTTPRHLEIRVTDHGPGIPASEHRRIFRAFHKSAREAAESRPGVGLGLALSRRLATSLGGTLTIIGSPQGATFLLTLPLA